MRALLSLWCMIADIDPHLRSEPFQVLRQMKYVIASELGINLKQGYNGGYMIMRTIEQQERQMSGK